MKSEVARMFVYHLSYNYLAWTCFEVLSSSFRTLLASTTLNIRLQRILVSKQNSFQWSLAVCLSLELSLFWSAVFLTSNFIVLHYIELRLCTENISFKAKFTVSSASVKVGFTDTTISILEKSRSLRFCETSLQLSGKQSMGRPQMPHGYYCAICSFKIMQKKKTKRVLWPVPTA